jgi:flagellar FliJ protein
MTMRFPFSLQPLLDWKRNLEEVAQIRLTGKITLLKSQEKEIENLTLKRLAYEEELRNKISQGITGREYVLYKQFAEESRADLKIKEQKKRETAQEIERDREKLIQLSKEKKVLERLKEKKQKSFLYQMEKGEQKRNDEMVITRYRPLSQRKGD